MGQLHSIANFRHKFEDQLTLRQRELLERAVGKLVVIGEQAGVSAGQMIMLLESGLTMQELLDYLAFKHREIGTDIASDT